MGDCFLDGVRIGDDGRDATGQVGLPAAPGPSSSEAILAVMTRAFAEMPSAAEATVAAMAEARVAYWQVYPLQFWKVCPTLSGIIGPRGPQHAALMRDAAEDLLAGPIVVQPDYRNVHALRLWADRIEAAIGGKASEKSKKRSRTYLGIAEAMAQQWGRVA